VLSVDVGLVITKSSRTLGTVIGLMVIALILGVDTLIEESDCPDMVPETT
jgi:hypothetical protein